MPITDNNFSGKLDKLELWPNWVIGVGLKWEVFEGMQRKHRIDETKLDKELLVDKRKDSEDKLNLLLAKQKSDWQTQNDMISIRSEERRVGKESRRESR